VYLYASPLRGYLLLTLFHFRLTVSSDLVVQKRTLLGGAGSVQQQQKGSAFLLTSYRSLSVATFHCLSPLHTGTKLYYHVVLLLNAFREHQLVELVDESALHAPQEQVPAAQTLDDLGRVFVGVLRVVVAELLRPLSVVDLYLRALLSRQLWATLGVLEDEHVVCAGARQQRCGGHHTRLVCNTTQHDEEEK
jgi:hypothetical protein